jgi:LytS/YehU family sensor histidine kinase
MTTGKLLLIFIAFFGLHVLMIYWNMLNHKAEWDRLIIYTKERPVQVTWAGVIRMTRNSIILNLSAVLAIAIAIKLLKRWWLKQREAEQAARAKISAELQLLKAQIHPHFLFNSLNNIYSFALEASPKAPEMIKKLSGLLHYMLYECKQDKVSLTKELMMINDYISLEKIRYGERLKIDIQLPKDNDHQMIAPLLLIPFVENSFKHGTSKMLSNPYVRLNITVQGDMLYFKLTNSRPVAIEEITVDGNRGLGLKNVRKRLELLYPKKYELQIMDDSSAYSVWMKIDMADETALLKKDKSVYELA